MATNKLKIRDIFNAVANPGTSLLKSVMPSPSAILNTKKTVVPPAPGPMSRMTAPMSRMPVATPVAPTPATTGTPTRAGSGAPVGPIGSTGAAPAVEAPRQWMRADGSFKTPEEIASDITGTLRGVASGPDIGRIAGNQFGENKTAEQLATEARLIGNTRNDIAVGDKDQYKVASQSGIAYTPAELSAIEKAYAGIYDPALSSAMSKLETRQKADAELSKWENELKKLAIEHNYDMEKMEKDQAFQYGLAGYKAALDAKNTSNALSPFVEERQFRVVDNAAMLKKIADENPKIFGRSAAVPLPDFLRSDEFRNFAADLSELKNAIFTKELQEMRADSKTGGAVGQVAIQEMKSMENALGALNMEQTPQNISRNLQQVINSVNRYRAVKGYSPFSGTASTGTIVTAPDGTVVEIVD